MVRASVLHTEGRRFEPVIAHHIPVQACRTLTHEHLLQRVWGPDKGEDSGPVREIIKRLRRNLADDANNPTYILNEPRVGYNMEKAETRRGDGAPI